MRSRRQSSRRQRPEIAQAYRTYGALLLMVAACPERFGFKKLGKKRFRRAVKDGLAEILKMFHPEPEEKYHRGWNSRYRRSPVKVIRCPTPNDGD